MGTMETIIIGMEGTMADTMADITEDSLEVIEADITEAISGAISEARAIMGMEGTMADHLVDSLAVLEADIMEVISKGRIGEDTVAAGGKQPSNISLYTLTTTILYSRYVYSL